MIAKSTDFGNLFASGKSEAFALVSGFVYRGFDSPVELLIRKYNDRNLCSFVFETESDAEQESRIYPEHLKVRVQQVSYNLVIRFLATEFGQNTIVFVRDRSGSITQLDTPE